MTRKMKSLVQNGIRLIHSYLFDRGLSQKIALCLHDLEAEQYVSFGYMVKFFRDYDYQFVDPDTFLSGNGHKKILLSFDDNYHSWYAASELFDRLNVRATFYVNPIALRDHADRSTIENYFDRINYRGRRRPLSSSELRTLHKAGHTIGSHTYSHRRLSSLHPADAREEILRGKNVLEDVLDHPVRHFSYPYGKRREFSRELRDYCREIGFATIANATGGLQHADHQPMDIHRSVWRLDQPFAYNFQNLRIDGSYFENLTGRSATG